MTSVNNCHQKTLEFFKAAEDACLRLPVCGSRLWRVRPSPAASCCIAVLPALGVHSRTPAAGLSAAPGPLALSAGGCGQRGHMLRLVSMFPV